MPVSPEKLIRYFGVGKEETKERCGFVLQGNRLVEVQNIHSKPEEGFEIDPQSIIRHEDQLKGTWHTHPRGPATLSEDDYACFLNWPHLEHYIISPDEVRRYVVEDGIILNAD
jgi:proteasome lid subunit RPN8/RPN11